MDTLRVGILGLGRGITHPRNFLSLDNVEVVGACDRLPLRRLRGQEQVAQAGAATRIVPEPDDLLAMRPDAVVVASNGKRQVQHAVQAMEAGCHVLSEVPGAYTEEECLRLRAAVERTGRTYMLGENTCFRTSSATSASGWPTTASGPSLSPRASTSTTFPGR
jgi:predicted dehydrogenase